MVLTEQDKARLNAQYFGQVVRISLKADKKANKEAEDFVFKKPTMVTVSASAVFSDTDPIRANQIIFNDCLVFGDKEAANDPERFLAIAPHLSSLLKTRQAEVGEL
jgi:phage tail sheath protein FI